MKGKEFTLTMICYDKYEFFWSVLRSRMNEVERFFAEIAKLIAEDLTFEFNYCDAFYSRQIRCACYLKKVVDNDCTIFEFSVKTNCKNDDMVPLLIDTLYEVTYEYIDEHNVEVEIK